MVLDQLTLSMVNVVAAAVLIVAALGKLAAPSRAARALSEVAGGRGRLGIDVIRLAAGIELAVAVALLLPLTRLPAAFAVAGLGIVFAALGVAGRVRHAVAPCGCFGRNDRPLGLRNSAVGVGLVATAPLNAAMVLDTGQLAGTLLLTSLAALGLRLMLSRTLVRALVVRRPARS